MIASKWSSGSQAWHGLKLTGLAMVVMATAMLPARFDVAVAQERYDPYASLTATPNPDEKPYNDRKTQDEEIKANNECRLTVEGATSWAKLYAPLRLLIEQMKQTSSYWDAVIPAENALPDADRESMDPGVLLGPSASSVDRERQDATKAAITKLLLDQSTKLDAALIDAYEKRVPNCLYCTMFETAGEIIKIFDGTAEQLTATNKTVFRLANLQAGHVNNSRVKSAVEYYWKAKKASDARGVGAPNTATWEKCVASWARSQGELFPAGDCSQDHTKRVVATAKDDLIKLLANPALATGEQLRTVWTSPSNNWTVNSQNWCKASTPGKFDSISQMLRIAF